MISKMTRVTILVRDQEEALRWFTEKLGVEKRADEGFGQNFRWLTVAPKDQKEVESPVDLDGEFSLEEMDEGERRKRERSFTW